MRLVILLVLVSSTCFGQQFIKGGLTMAYTSADAPDGAVRRMTPGFTAGLAFNRHLKDRLFFRPEVAFIQKGERSTTSTEEFKARLNYVEVPVLLVWSLMKEQHPVELLLESGPSIGYGFGGRYKVTSPGGSQGGAIKFGERPAGANVNDIYLDNPIDICLQFGLVVMVRQRLMFGFRFGTGITSLTEAPSPVPAGARQSDYYSYNRTFQLTIGWARPARKPDGY